MSYGNNSSYDHYSDGYNVGYQHGSEERYDDIRMDVIMIIATEDDPLAKIKELFQIW